MQTNLEKRNKYKAKRYENTNSNLFAPEQEQNFEEGHYNNKALK